MALGCHGVVPVVRRLMLPSILFMLKFFMDFILNVCPKSLGMNDGVGEDVDGRLCRNADAA